MLRGNCMKCIFCGSLESKVIDSRYLKDTSIRRRRECITCHKRFTTYETVETNPMVVTNVNNLREPFKYEKLHESITYAMYSRGYELEILRAVTDEIEKRLLALQKQEITTQEIVTVAANVLKEVDVITSVVYFCQHSDCAGYEDIKQFINR